LTRKKSSFPEEKEAKRLLFLAALRCLVTRQRMPAQHQQEKLS
jgi:hypothetical protein